MLKLNRPLAYFQFDFPTTGKMVPYLSSAMEKTSNCSILFSNRLWGKYVLFSFNFAWKMTICPVLKGNNSCKTYNFGIKVGNLQNPFIHLSMLLSVSDEGYSRNASCALNSNIYVFILARQLLDYISIMYSQLKQLVILWQTSSLIWIVQFTSMNTFLFQTYDL
jgi:hypothetical protein